MDNYIELAQKYLKRKESKKVNVMDEIFGDEKERLKENEFKWSDKQ